MSKAIDKDMKEAADQALEDEKKDPDPEWVKGKENDLPEAPASWNMTFLNKAGFRCQVTLRDERLSSLLRKVYIVEEIAEKNEWKPAWSWRKEINKKEKTEKVSREKCDYDHSSLKPLQVKKEGKNKGRWFVSCRKCDYFKWVDF